MYIYKKKIFTDLGTWIEFLLVISMSDSKVIFLIESYMDDRVRVESIVENVYGTDPETVKFYHKFIVGIPREVDAGPRVTWASINYTRFHKARRDRPKWIKLRRLLEEADLISYTKKAVYRKFEENAHGDCLRKQISASMSVKALTCTFLSRNEEINVVMFTICLHV